MLLSLEMCVRKCSRLVGPCLAVLAVLSIMLSLFLLCPNCDGSHFWVGHIGTDVIKTFQAGVWLGGVLVFLIGVQTTLAGYNVRCLPCCGPRIGMSFSFAICILGVYGAFTSLQYAKAVLNNGPYCLYKLSKEGEEQWGYPLTTSNQPAQNMFDYPISDELYNEVYLFGITFWHSVCLEPPNIIPWDACFSACLFLVYTVETILCISQLINACFGMCCGLRDSKKKGMSLVERRTVSDLI